jgi:hypothetical protein
MRSIVPTNCWRAVPLPTFLRRTVSAFCKVRRSVLVPHHPLTPVVQSLVSDKPSFLHVALRMLSSYPSGAAARCLGFMLAKAGSSSLIYLVALLRSTRFAGSHPTLLWSTRPSLGYEYRPCPVAWIFFNFVVRCPYYLCIPRLYHTFGFLS